MAEHKCSFEVWNFNWNKLNYTILKYFINLRIKYKLWVLFLIFSSDVYILTHPPPTYRTFNHAVSTLTVPIFYTVLGRANFTLMRTFGEGLLISCILLHFGMILLNRKDNTSYQQKIRLISLYAYNHMLK